MLVSVKEKMDVSYNMICIEVRSKEGDLYFGYVFLDGLGLNGFCYCINFVVFWFILKEELEKEGYSDFLILFGNKK